MKPFPREDNFKAQELEQSISTTMKLEMFEITETDKKSRFDILRMGHLHHYTSDCLRRKTKTTKSKGIQEV